MHASSSLAPSLSSFPHFHTNTITWAWSCLLWSGLKVEWACATDGNNQKRLRESCDFQGSTCLCFCKNRMVVLLVYLFLLYSGAFVSLVTWKTYALTIYAVLLTVLLTVYAVVAPPMNTLEQWLNTRHPITTITTGFTSDLKYINLKILFKIIGQAKLFSSFLSGLKRWVYGCLTNFCPAMNLLFTNNLYPSVPYNHRWPAFTSPHRAHWD